jgi:hypothetical protein
MSKSDLLRNIVRAHLDGTALPLSEEACLIAWRAVPMRDGIAIYLDEVARHGMRGGLESDPATSSSS